MVVKISTPRGAGTAFLLTSSHAAGLYSIATAAHVVDNAHYWDEPIRIHHPKSNETTVLRSGERAILLREALDTAAIVFQANKIQFPAKPFELPPESKHLRVGYEIGWMGFPSIAPTTLCFFSGRISSWLEARSSYLVDGVAINGVSGGPVFQTSPGEKGATVIGIVTAYIPNRETGEVLPGLCEVRDVTQMQAVVKTFRTLDQAKEGQTVPKGPPPPAPESGPPEGERPKRGEGSA